MILQWRGLPLHYFYLVTIMKKYWLLLGVCFLLGCNFNRSRMEDESRMKKCGFSFDSFKKRNLVTIVKELEKKIESIPDSVGFVAAYVLENENHIAIVLKDTSSQNIQYFKKNVMNSSFFEFHLGTDIVFEEETSVNN